MEIDLVFQTLLLSSLTAFLTSTLVGVITYITSRKCTKAYVYIIPYNFFLFLERTIPEAVMTHAAGIHIFVIGVGLSGNNPEIQALATPPAEQNRYLVNDFDELRSSTRQIFTKLCDSM